MYLIFFGFFAAEGIIYPFWPTWLDSLGFSASEIGLLIAAAYWPQVVTGVLITYVADWRVDQLRLAAVLSVTAALCTLLFYFIPAHLWMFVCLSVLFGGVWMVVLPLSESYLLKRDKLALQNYGWVRAVGSSAFILTSTLGGFLFAQYSQSGVPLVIAASMLLTAVACLRLKRQVSRAQLAPSGPARKRPDWRALLAHKSLLIAIAAASFIQLSHTLYFSTASIGWGVKGFSSSAIGMFWAVAVIAEITWFALSNKVLAFCAPLSLVMFSSVCAALRWALFANSDAVSMIILGQCLHALSFAAYHAAIMRFIRDQAPPDIQVFTQGVYYSLAVALPMGLATPFAGYLYETQPQWSYYVMALFALVATVLAFIAHQKMRSATHGSTNVYSRLL